MKLRYFAFLIIFVALLPVAFTRQSSVVKPPATDWVLTWSDEFNGPNGAPPDPAKWSIETGGSGWGNEELEYYTDRRQNAHQESGNLVIEALQENFTGPDGVHRDYTSARLKTAGHFTQKYGRFEARIQIPSGQGMWPAFWALGDDITATPWPACGEIDIMENVGFEPNKIHGTLHGPGYFGDHGITSVYTLPAGNVADTFRIFAVEWESNAIRLYMDGVLYATKSPSDVPPDQRWVFDHPFFLILNLAVGGNWPHSPDASTVFPKRMLVDYVRVYSRK